MGTAKKDKKKPTATKQNFPIVGIGASAGGLDAFKRLLTVIPENSGMAYVLVQHLDPSHESFLPEILQRTTKIPVYEVTEDIHLAPNNIYIIPSNKLLTSTDGVLKLTVRNKKILNLSIDTFFTSLAEVHKEFAVGVLLSGTGSDGTLGLKAIKDHGGITIVQDMESAAYNDMPQSAVNAGVVDFVLAPEKIPEQLLKINKTYKTSHVFKIDEEVPKDEKEIYKQILSLLHLRSGVDFTFYKRPTFYRRIARRIAMVNKINLSEYLKFLRANVAEQDALFQDILIPVTSFFRDPKAFQNLTDAVFPAIFKDKSAGQPFRAWVAGCSTGQEAYSIAIGLQEFLSENFDSNRERSKIQIFASDISEEAIKKARAGIYTKADVEPLSKLQLKKYFTKHNEGYEVSKLIRDMCVFAPHNFLKDPPFAKMDLISCRNVFIYMDTFLQKKALTGFHYALKENGFLLLGKSEGTSAASELFTTFNQQEKIYSRNPVPGRFMHITSDRNEEGITTKDKKETKQKSSQTDFRKSAEAIMISKSPASVIVNEQLDIVHIHGDITPFLQVPQGKPTHSLLKMARKGLGFELRNAVHKAIKEKAAVTKENIPVKTNGLMADPDNYRDEQGKQSLVSIEIIPLTDTVEQHFLIRFEKIVIPAYQEEKLSSSGKIKKEEADNRNEELEKELTHVREDMRSITEDMEASNEELQSANEELQSSNEEMQSLNEELETSKEELQSTNEELIIINQELLDKQEQLNASRYYAESIVSTIREPLVILDKTLKIKTANSSFYKVFNIDEKDTEGKLFYEIQNHLWDDNAMRLLLKNILTKKERLTDYEIILKSPESGEHTMLLNANQIINEKTSEQLILLAIEDITKQKNNEKELIKSKNTAETATEIAENAMKAKQQFLANMSHEIRTPMNAILGFTKVLLRTDISDKNKEFVQAIKTSSDTLIVLINDILDLAKVDAGKMIFEYHPFKLVKSINTLLQLFEVNIQEKNLKLIKVFDENIPELLIGDSVRLNQIILNLMSNAVKFTKTGSITVTVRMLQEDKKNVTLNFEFTDTGIGIDKDNLETVFNSFEQAKSSTSGIYGGTGLGLAIVKQLVESQGGTISVKSKVNEGTTFSFTLGFQKSNTEIQPETVIDESDHTIHNIKVLVVEDVALNQLLIRTLLEDFKFDCDIAENGQIAIEKLKSNSYDIVLMDLQMPVMDGFTATKYIREKLKSNIPIIALTADVTTVDTAKCLAIGMNDYITKPIDEKLLRKKIVDLLKVEDNGIDK